MEEVKNTSGLKEESQAPTTDELLEMLVESNAIIAVALCRLYDVQMCMYDEIDHEDAQELIAVHKQGKLRSQIPFYNPEN